MEALISPIPVLTIFLLVAVICALAFICWRTQSLHFLVRRFWLLVHGNKDIPDPQIQAFSQEQTSLYAFRLFSGTQVQSLEQAHQLIAWSQQQKVPMATISTCGDCFDLEKHEIRAEKLPGKFYRAALFMWLVTLIITTASCVYVAIAAPGLLTLKITERWVVFQQTSASAVFRVPFITNALDLGDCKYQNPERLKATKFTEEEIKTICDLFITKEWPEEIKKKINDQRKSFLISALFFFACFAIHIPSVNKHYHARELHKKLTQPEEINNEHTTT